MVIDGDWGTGKTEFCHKLINLLAKENTHNLIYVDAFQADHADEPLLTILAEILRILPEGEKRDSFIKKALPAVRYGLKTLVKASVSHLLKQDTDSVIEGFDNSVQKIADRAIDASVESLLKDHVKANESLLTLQDAMKEIATTKPIIMFIDELDRCRPDFAVSILEIIKHTFAIDGVQFVLVTNTLQLKASINHSYGKTVDAQRYLDKFLKFTFTLPNTFSNNLGNEQSVASICHYQNLVNQSVILEPTQLAYNDEFDFISHVIKTQNLSLREVETLVRYLEIYQQLSDNEALAENVVCGYKLLRLFGVILFCFKKEVASKLTQKRADAQELATFLGEHSIVPIFEGGLEALCYQVVLTMIGQECFYNSDLFKPEEGQHDAEWDNLINTYFKHSSYSPQQGERSKIVMESIQTLSLL